MTREWGPSIIQAWPWPSFRSSVCLNRNQNPMRAAWLTDIHLNFLRTDDLYGFLDALWAMNVDAFLVSGDIAEAMDILYYLKKMDAALDRPVFFVLGNHDYYHGSIRTVREQVVQFCAEHPKFHYLTAEGMF